MPLPPAQLQACLQAIGAFIEKRRPPVHIRPKLDIRADINGSEVVIYHLRPHFENAHEILELPFAKAKWIDSHQVWRLFWMRASGKWNAYQPFPQTKTIEAILAEVDRDPHGCFFG